MREARAPRVPPHRRLPLPEEPQVDQIRGAVQEGWPLQGCHGSRLHVRRQGHRR